MRYRVQPRGIVDTAEVPARLIEVLVYQSAGSSTQQAGASARQSASDCRLVRASALKAHSQGDRFVVAGSRAAPALRHPHFRIV